MNLADGSHVVAYVALLIGGAILLYTPFGYVLKSKLLCSETLLCTAVGILFGPLAAGWLTPVSWAGAQANNVIIEISRLVIAIQVVNTATDLPTLFLTRHWGSVAVTLTMVMIGMWVTTAALVLAVFPELSVLQATLIGACLTPTDPVLSTVFLRGRLAETYVPLKVRHLLNAESAANDGLALPLVELPVLLLLNTGHAGRAIGLWFADSWAYSVLLSIAVGLVWGAVVALAWREALKRRTWDTEAQAATLLALALAVFGGLDAMRSDGVLGAFCAGLVFGQLQAAEEGTEIMEREQAIDAIEIILIFVYFIFFGSILPWQQWGELGAGRLIVLVIAVTLLRRMPVVMLAYACHALPIYVTKREALLTGFFGPIGVAAVFWSALATTQLSGAAQGPNGNPAGPTFAICTFVVLCHVVIYSIAGPLVSYGYGIYEGKFVIPLGPEEAIRTVPTHTEHLEFGVWPPTTLVPGATNLLSSAVSRRRARLPGAWMVPPDRSSPSPTPGILANEDEGAMVVAGADAREGRPAGSAPGVSLGIMEPAASSHVVESWAPEAVVATNSAGNALRPSEPPSLGLSPRVTDG